MKLCHKALMRPSPIPHMKFKNIATQFNLIGDCTGNCGNIQKSIRNAFFVASEI